MTEPEAPFSRRDLQRDAVPATATGVGIFRRHPRAWIGTAAGLAFLLLCVGALFAGAAVGSSRQSAAAPATSAPPTSAAPTARAVPNPVPDAEALRTCSVDSLARDPRLGDFAGFVSNLTTGSTLFTRAGDNGAIAPGELELLTAALAIKQLGPDYSLSTKVYAGADPGTIVLVGGGDPTLSALPVGTQSVYPDAPRLADLATQVQTVLGGQQITKIVVDSSLWPESDAWSSGWPRTLVGGGQLSEITALQVDGDRKDPTKEVSPRSGHPVQNAGTAFESALGLSGVPIEEGTVAEGATQLAVVSSQPLSSLVTTMLQLDDATLAESLARIVSITSGGDGTLASYQNLAPAGISDLGLDASGVTVFDGSGTSAKNSIPPSFLASLVALLKKGENNLNVVYNAMSVAGTSGSLQDRYTGKSAEADGAIAAQAGSGALAGLITAKDGTELAFSVVSSKRTSDADTAIDTLTAGMYACGANLSNH